MSFTSFLADAEALRDRGEWYVFIYLVNSAGATITLKYGRDNQGRGSTTGPTAITVGSITIPAHSIFRKRLLTVPAITQSMWKPGTILSHSLPSFGEMVLNNRDGGLERYRPAKGYRWNNQRIQILYADRENIQNTIGLVFDARLGQPRFTLGSVSVPVLGREADFNVPTSTRVFRGTSYQLELSGARSAGFGAPAALNITGSLTLETWIWIDTAPAATVNMWGWLVAGFLPWVMVLTSTRQVRFSCHIGGVAESVTTTATLSTLAPYHVSIVVSGRNVTFRIWDEDAQNLITETFTNGLSSATRSTNVGGAVQVNSSGVAVIWFDEMRVWNVARTATEIAKDRHRPIPSGSIPASLVHLLHMDDGSGTTVTDSSATAANGTITGAGTSAWIWAMEGGAELAGVAKPDVWGHRFGVKPIVVDPIRYICCVAGGGLIKTCVTYEGGNAHTAAGNYATQRDLFFTSPSAGGMRLFPNRGLFRLGSQPTLPVAATVEGYQGGSLGYVSNAGGVTRDIITRRGPKIADPGGLDTSSFTAYISASPAEVGIALYAPNTEPEYIAPVLDMVNVGGAGWWGYVGSSVLFHLERFVGPAVTADYDLKNQIISVEEVYPPPPVIYEVVVRYRKSDVVLTEEQVAGAVKGTANWQQWTLAQLEKRALDETLMSEHEGSGGLSLVLDAALYSDSDAQSLADSLLDVLKGVKEVFTVTLRATGLQIQIGMTVTLYYQFTDSRQGLVTRYDLDGTKKYVVIDKELTAQEGMIRMTVWG